MLKRLLLNILVKPVAIVLAGTAIGLVFAILPCYAFPYFGADPRDWCGYKSEPPHFVLQFWTGFLFAAATATYFAYRPRGNPKPVRG